MRILVTGGSGFVGRRMLARLAGRRAAGEPLELHALFRDSPGEPPRPAEPWAADVEWHATDLVDRAGVVRVVRAVAPERAFHFAAIANPRDCAAHPAAAFAVNAGGTAALLAGLAPGRCRALAVSSAQVYGRRVEGILPEDQPARADSAYGRSKRCAELIALRFARRGLAVVVARPFNHAAREQSPRYVLPALAAQVRGARDAGTPLATGNLWPRRDFLHVEDVLDAYELLIERGAPGTTYNVCRGETHSIGEALAGLQARMGTHFEPFTDPERARADDIPELGGEPSRLRALGWAPRISFEQLLDELAQG